MTINRIEEVVKASENISQRDWSTWVDVWYDCKTCSLYTEQEVKKLKKTKTAYKVGQLIRPNTASEVEQMVRRWMCM